MENEKVGAKAEAVAEVETTVKARVAANAMEVVAAGKASVQAESSAQAA